MKVALNMIILKQFLLLQKQFLNLPCSRVCLDFDHLEHALTCWSNSKQKLKGNYGKSVQCQVRIIEKLKKSSKIEYHHSMKVLIMHSTVGNKVGH